MIKHLYSFSLVLTTSSEGFAGFASWFNVSGTVSMELKALSGYDNFEQIQCCSLAGIE